MHFKINLTLISVLVIVLFFSIPTYNRWLTTNLLNPNTGYTVLSKQLGLEQRMNNRFGYPYMIYKNMTNYLDKAKIKNPVILFPPDQYLKEHKVANMTVVEPLIFYYFTGHKAVWYDSPEVEKANYVMINDANNNVSIREINSKAELDALLETFKKYKLTL